jgi:hypothetical protein
MNEPPPKLDTLVEVDPALGKLVEQMLEKDPLARPSSMGRVRQELARLREMAQAENRSLYGLPGLGALKPARPARSNAGRNAALAVLALAIAGGATFAAVKMSSHPPPPPVAVQPVPQIAPPQPVPTAPPAPKVARLSINTNAPGTRVYIDKSDTDKSTEPVATGVGLLRVSVPPAQSVVLRVEADGYKSFTTPLRLEAGDDSSIPVVMVAVGDKRPSRIGPKATGQAQPAKQEQKATNSNMIDPF